MKNSSYATASKKQENKIQEKEEPKHFVVEGLAKENEGREGMGIIRKGKLAKQLRYAEQDYFTRIRKIKNRCNPENCTVMCK